MAFGGLWWLVVAFGSCLGGGGMMNCFLIMK